MANYRIRFREQVMGNFNSKDEAADMVVWLLGKPGRFGLPMDAKLKDFSVVEESLEQHEPVYDFRGVYEPEHDEAITETEDWEFKRPNYTETVEHRHIPARTRVELYRDSELVERDVRVMKGNGEIMSLAELEELGGAKVYEMLNYEE